ncbi:hypothetical protein MBLNU459_g7555t2 [Dothideomycetes sp. NU459]
MADFQVELDQFTNADGGLNAERQHFSLPRADGGRDAWLFLASTFILEALVWGFPFSFGVFEAYYATHEPFSQDAAGIAAIGTSATGIMYFAAPIVYTGLKKYPAWRRTSTLVGFVILLASLVIASFLNSVGALVATQGIMYGIGGALHYFPALLYLDEWFVQRKGIAFGAICAGGGAAGVAIPLTMEWVLDHFGFRTALRVWIVVVIVLTTPALFFMKGRLPIRHQANVGPQKIEIGFLRTKAFWLLQATVIVQGLGYFLPSIYISSFAQSVGLTATDGTIAIALTNGAAVVGSLLMGWLSDRYHCTTAILACAIGSVVSVFLLWSFAVSRPVLFLFALTYGVFASGFASTWAGCAKPMRENGYPGTETGMIIALFSSGKGIGAVISGPLSEALVAADGWKGKAAFAYGSGYGSLIICTGVTAGFAGVSWCGRRFGIL